MNTNFDKTNKGKHKFGMQNLAKKTQFISFIGYDYVIP